jgi:hypothetical protein
MSTFAKIRKCSWVVMFAAVTAGAHAQTALQSDPNSLDEAARVQAQSVAQRAKTLQTNITRGWSMATVRKVMGEPERVQRSADGGDVTEVWGYSGFDVRIVFQNGLVASWFIRFAQ